MIRRLVVPVLLALAAAPVAAQEIDSEDALLVSSARLAIERGQHQRAARLLDRALRVNPRRIDAYVLRASVYAVTKQHARGVSLLRHARKLAPSNPDVLTALGGQLILSRRAAEGVPLLERVTKTWPRRYQAHAVLGHHYNDARRWPDAIAALRSYFRWRPGELAKNDAVHRVALAEALLRSGRPREALAIYRSVLAADRSNLLGRLGVAWAEAAIDCRRGLMALAKLDGLAARHPSILLLEGRCALRLRRTKAARRVAKRYLALRPGDPAAHALFARVLEQAGQLDRARSAMQAALRRAPGRASYSIELARLERRSGNAAAAIARLRRIDAPRSPALRARWTIELAESLGATRRYVEVRALLTPYVAASNHNAEQLATAQLLLGTAYLELGDSKAGLGLLERAARGPLARRARAPLRKAYLMMARSAVAKNNLSVAESQLLRLSRLGLDPSAQRLLGLVRLLQKRPAEAVAPLRAAVASDRSDSMAALLLGRALRSSNDTKGARASLRAALALRGLEEQRRFDLTIELAVTELVSSPRAALSLLAALPAKMQSPAMRKRALDAYHAAARKVATRWLRSGAHRRAHALLGELARVIGTSDPRYHDIMCDLALAATGARQHQAALAALRRLVNRRRCPFDAPADKLAVPILAAWNRGMLAGQAVRSLSRVQRLRRRATGVAAALARAATRDLAIRAAIEAYEGGRVHRARLHLRRAAQIERDSPEMQHNQAVLMLATRRVTPAIAVLEKVAPRVPEAWVSLGIAYERQGKPVRALWAYRRAYRAGVRMRGTLRRWIAIKERLWGTK